MRMVGGAIAAAAGAGLAMAGVAALSSTTSRIGSLGVLIAAGLAGAFVAAVALPFLTRRPWRALVGAAA
jgi:hypothetical protein